jgi:rRNA maturation endonuclease Nob1
MKRCLLCGCIDEAGDAKTCPYCGEATWSKQVSIATVVEEAVQAVEPTPAQKRRGRR